MWSTARSTRVQRRALRVCFGDERMVNIQAEIDMNATIPRGFLDALPASRRAADISEADDIFGFMIGSWDVDAVLHDADGQHQTVKGEVHATWVLEGRAIQDLFIFPRRIDRAANIPVRGDRYGTTIKTFDRHLDAWHVNFINPADDHTSAALIARRHGRDITMEGRLSDGTPIRWRYDSITSTSFHYTAERLGTDGRSWRIYLELSGSRCGD